MLDIDFSEKLMISGNRLKNFLIKTSILIVAIPAYGQTGSSTYLTTSQLGAANGVASLDKNVLLPTGQVPFGATSTSSANSAVVSHTVADDGLLGYLINQVMTYEQNAAVNFLTVARADNGVVHVLGATGAVETVGRTLAQRAGDVWNIADHGALGDAASDSAALNNGLTYAGTRASQGLGTVVTAPAGTWPLSVSSSQQGFAIPTNTVLEGAANNATIFTWNDRNTGNLPSGQPCTMAYLNANPGTVCGWSLFVSPNPSNGGRNSNVVIRNFTIQGTWGPCSGCSYIGSGNNAVFLSQTDDVTVDHVTSRYSGAFGMTVRSSTNVKLLDDGVYYSSSDGINLDDDSGIFARNFNIQHTADDCFSAHSDIYDQQGVRRNIQIIGGYCFDTHAIDIASAVSLSITGTHIDSFKTAAISLYASPAGNGATEGNSEGQDVTIDNVIATNGISTYNSNTSDPANFDPKDPTDTTVNYVIVGSANSRAGSSLTYIPGENGTSPYPYVLSNSNSSSIPIAAWRTFRITNSIFGRHFGATNTKALPSWASLGQGGITTKDGIYTPMLTEADLIGSGILIRSPNIMRNLTIANNAFEGLSNALSIPSNSNLDMKDFSFSNNRMIDMRYQCVDIEYAGIIDGELSDNYCNADPYFASGNRGSIGNWNNNNALIGFNIDAQGLTVQRNSFLNVSNDTNVNTSDPTTGDLFRDNVDYANPQTVNTYNIYNGGIGYVHSGGFRLVQIGTNPADSSWDKVLNVPIEAAMAQPTTGFWTPGEFVRNIAPNSSNTVMGWLRITLSNNGSTYPYAAPTNDTAGTDWVAR